MGDKKDIDEDPRYEFICEYITKTMRLKSDKWPKLVGNEEYKVSKTRIKLMVLIIIKFKLYVCNLQSCAIFFFF